MSKSGQDSGETTTFHSGPHVMPALEGDEIALPVIDLKSAAAEFELGELLGKGGMGQVVSAKQKALQRSVAIKFLNDEASDASLLLREAITTGRLEHPNIVPVHVLAKTTEGVPFFTMKRVEGTPWSDALKGKRSLVEHLEVLQRVCDALSFAHSRGVIHRDLKPANVLIGAFGEVYLVDWGLAASLHPDSVLPLASEAGMGGTPSYLAPEAALGTGKLGPWTDIFLLGATLYEVLMGRPPWVAGSVQETLVLATEANGPLFDAMVPTELENICRRAMQRDPSARYESAKAFKEAITGYLRHHDALELHERTLEKLDELARTIRGEPSAVSIERLFTECRFGFEQVRRSWPDFEPARVGLRRALVLMVRHELARQAPQSARALLSELVQPPAELVLEVENAERAEKEKAARLIQLEQQAKDSSTDAVRDLKSTYTKVVAVGAILSSVVMQALSTSGAFQFNVGHGLVFALVLLLNSFVYSLWLKNQPEANQLQRRISLGLVGMSVASVLLWWMALREGVIFHAAVIAYYLISGAGWWTAAVTVEKRGTIVAAGFGLAAVVGMIFPAFILGAGGSIGLSMLVLSRVLRTGAPSPLGRGLG